MTLNLSESGLESNQPQVRFFIPFLVVLFFLVPQKSQILDFKTFANSSNLIWMQRNEMILML